MADCMFVGGIDYTKPGYYSVPLGGSRPLSEQVADLEKRKAQVEKELADLKAKRDAEEAAKAKPMTYGDRAAADLIAFDPDDTCRDGYDEIRITGAPTLVIRKSSKPYSRLIADKVQRAVAAALDKAHADGRAEQREKDATMLDRVAAFGYPFDDGKSYSCGRGDAYRAAARIIRDNK